jgi:hypothetical protein
VSERYKVVMLNKVTGEERLSVAMKNSGPFSSKEANAIVRVSKKRAARSKTNWIYKKVLI